MSGASARALDGDILAAIGRWHQSGETLGEAAFDELALAIFRYQLAHNVPYARYCASLGVSESALPSRWTQIPAVPAAAYKEAQLATFPVAGAALVFHTSGTTAGAPGRHFMETRALYDAALLAAFDRFVLPDRAALRYLNAVPNPAERPHSSLGYMMQQVALHRGDAQTGWYVRGDELLTTAFCADVEAAIAERQPVCLTATAFACVHLLDALEARGVAYALPEGSRIVETGGFKGRSRTLEREELYDELAARFGIGRERILAEYGMTELTSQYYDDVLVRPAAAARPVAARRKLSPPWLRARVVGPDGRELPDGSVGALVHVDLANRSSCVAIATEDLGVKFGDGLVLIGRERGAELRGCSLDAESLQPR